MEVLRAADVPLCGRGTRTAERLDADQVRRGYEGGASLRGLARAARTDDGVIRETLLGAGVPVRRQGRISKLQDVQTEAAESQNVVGIYAYALPHYLRCCRWLGVMLVSWPLEDAPAELSG